MTNDTCANTGLFVSISLSFDPSGDIYGTIVEERAARQSNHGSFFCRHHEYTAPNFSTTSRRLPDYRFPFRSSILASRLAVVSLQTIVVVVRFSRETKKVVEILSHASRKWKIHGSEPFEIFEMLAPTPFKGGCVTDSPNTVNQQHCHCRSRERIQVQFGETNAQDFPRKAEFPFP